MASQFDLEPRLAALQAAGLATASDYQGNPAKWLQMALDGCDVRVVNVKGIKADNVPVLVTLAAYEALIALAGGHASGAVVED